MILTLIDVAEESPNYFGLEGLLEEINELKDQHRMYHARSVASQHRELADDCNSRMFFEEEELSIDLAYICLDNYTIAMQSLRRDGNPDDLYCYETAAQIASALGKVYDKALKLDAKAHTFYLRAIQYADIVTHTNGCAFFAKAWYQEAKREIEAYRARRAAYDAKEVARQREPTLEKLKPH